MYNKYSQETLETIKTQLSNFKQSCDNPVAAFDADGTLWDLDVGEIVFDHQIKHWNLDLPKKPWGHYLNLKQQDPRKAYLWLAQILENKSLDEVLRKNKEAYLNWEKSNDKKLPIYPAQKELIEYLQEQGVEIYVVTASVAWSVVYGASLLGIPSSHVIGVRSKIVENKVSTEQDGPITYREGKALALKEKIDPSSLFLAVGNTMGDFELIRSAKLGLAVSSASEEEELFATEQELKQKAKEQNWLVHEFR